MDTPEKKKRIEFLDAWRGLAVVVMLFWHFAWDLTMWKFFPESVMFEIPATLVRYFIVCSFVLASGMSCRLSRSNLRRGVLTLLCGFAVSAAMAAVGDSVRMGILHLLGCCMILYALIGKAAERLPPAKTVMVLMLLFTVLLVITDAVRVEIPWLYPLGFRTREFYSADYYPLLPWGLMFFAGAVMGGKLRLPPEGADLPRYSPALCWIGRRALWIYLLHQPVLIGILWLFTGRLPF